MRPISSISMMSFTTTTATTSRAMDKCVCNAVDPTSLKAGSQVFFKVIATSGETASIAACPEDVSPFCCEAALCYTESRLKNVKLVALGKLSGVKSNCNTGRNACATRTPNRAVSLSLRNVQCQRFVMRMLRASCPPAWSRLRVQPNAMPALPPLMPFGDAASHMRGSCRELR